MDDIIYNYITDKHHTCKTYISVALCLHSMQEVVHVVELGREELGAVFGGHKVVEVTRGGGQGGETQGVTEV